jgi:hypothetical protein
MADHVDGSKIAAAGASRDAGADPADGHCRRAVSPPDILRYKLGKLGILINRCGRQA